MSDGGGQYAAVLDIDQTPQEKCAPGPVAPDKPYTAPPRQIWGWAAGRCGEFALVATFGQAMNIFTIGFGLSPVLVSWCMMLPRVIDGIIDPIVGHWSDDCRSRWGRRKPFLMGGALAGACFLAALWWASPLWRPAAQFAHLLLIGTCLYLCYGAYAMAWSAIGYELSDDYHERSKVAAIGGFFLAVMCLANSWMYWFALRPIFGNVIWGMRWVGGGMALLAVVSAAVTCLTTKERFTSSAARQHVPILRAVRTTLKNRPFVYLVLMKAFELFGGRLTGGVMFFLMVYYVCRGDQDLATRITGIGGTIGLVWNFAVLPFMKPISKRLGKRGALMAGAGISFACALATPFITTPRHPYWSLLPALVITPLLVISQTISNAILPDICDIDELQTGERREGLFTSVMGFVSKLEISLTVVLVGYIVSISALDTGITRRWEAMLDGKSTVVGGFEAGESAVFAFQDSRTMTFDQFAIISPVETGPKSIDLSVSNGSPSEGFEPVFSWRAADVAAARSPFSHFAPVTAKYVRVTVVSASAGDKCRLQELRFGSSNIFSSENGAKVVAATPPDHVNNRLYWLVMIPAIIFFGLTFLTTILFPLSESQMNYVRRELDQRRKGSNCE